MLRLVVLDLCFGLLCFGSLLICLICYLGLSFWICVFGYSCYGWLFWCFNFDFDFEGLDVMFVLLGIFGLFWAWVWLVVNVDLGWLVIGFDVAFLIWLFKVCLVVTTYWRLVWLLFLWWFSAFVLDLIVDCVGCFNGFVSLVSGINWLFACLLIVLLWLFILLYLLSFEWLFIFTLFVWLVFIDCLHLFGSF